MKKMKALQSKGNLNVHHMMLLLEAEECTLKKNIEMDVVRAKFDAAISAASRSGFANDSALANERAGVFCLTRGDTYWANSYITRAHQRWAEYGALALCRKLEKIYPQYITEEVKNPSMRAFLAAEKSCARRGMSRKSIVFEDATGSWSDIRSSTLTSKSSEYSRKSSGSVSTLTKLNISDLQ